MVHSRAKFKEVSSTHLISRALKSGLIFLFLAISACTVGKPHQGSVLREAQNRGTLRVVTLNSPTTYYEGREGKLGFEYDLSKAYAAYLGLELEIVTVKTISEVLQAVLDDKADIAAAGLTITEQRLKLMKFGPAYLQVQTRLVCNRKGVKPKNIKALGKVDLKIAAGSSFIETLKQLHQRYPYLHFKIMEQASVETLLDQIGRGKKFCTLADSYVFNLNRRYLPELFSPMALGEEQPIAWALGGGHSWRPISLERNLEAWFSKKTTQKLVETLKERYFQVSDTDFDYVDIARYRRAIRRKLPHLFPMFERAAKRYNVPWELLAAIGWRESRWRANARSHTGVRGLMMLTRISAKEAGVKNRLNAAQSIAGGARYFSRLLRRLPQSIVGDDRYWFALSAYNMGYAHMMDARLLAQQRGLNPDQWRDVRQVLPALEDPNIYQNLPRGYGAGLQAQDYVASVRNFYDILLQNEQRKGQ
jgi:peptidoglycan lytic transglycosylase F